MKRGYDKRRGRYSDERRARRAAPKGDLAASGLAVVALSLLAGFISLPLLSLLLWTFTGSAWEAMLSPVALQALWLSAKTTAVATLITVVVGTPAAYLLARTDFRGKRALDTLIDIPAVLPPSAAGLALLLAFGQLGLLGGSLQAFGVTLSFTTAAVVIAQLFVASHFYVRQATTGFATVAREVEEAALVDGAGRLGAVCRVSVPLAFPALMAGAVTAWARALGEFGATIIFAGNIEGVTQTMPLAIYAAFEQDLDAAVALSVMVLGFAFAVILTARRLTRAATVRED